MKINRINEIEQYIITRQSAKLEELCAAFNVSKNTIRRDIEEIVNRGTIKKVYGGVCALKKKENTYKTTLNNEAKKNICELASTLVNDGDTIFLDSGSTVFHILSFLSLKTKLTIISHSLNVIYEAAKYPNINIVALGGTFLRDTSSFVGLYTLDVLDNLKINKAFMGASSVSVENGFSSNTLLEAEIKKKIVTRSNEIYFLCDNSKVNTDSTVSFCKIKDIKALITDKKPDDNFVDYLNVNKVNLIYSL